MANNPSHEGLRAIREFYPSLHIALVVSLGTGKFDPEEIKEADILTSIRSFKFKDAASGLKALVESALKVWITIIADDLITYLCNCIYIV